MEHSGEMNKLQVGIADKKCDWIIFFEIRRLSLSLKKLGVRSMNLKLIIND